MSPRLDRRLSPRARRELTGLNWSLENGSRHAILRIDGQMIGILPRAGRQPESWGNRNGLSLITQIRRFKLHKRTSRT